MGKHAEGAQKEGRMKLRV